MALELLETLDVYYGSSKRSVSLYSGDLSELSEGEAVDYLAVSTLPNFYLADYGTLLYSLQNKGISVEALSRDKAVDYRPDIPCWISKDISGIQCKRLIIFEPDDPRTNAYDHVPYIFSAIAEREKGRTSDLKIALPMLCTGKSGADPVEIMEAMFYASVHWGAMKFPFKEIKLVVYNNSSQKDAIRKKFTDLKYTYETLESLSIGQAYSYYAKQAIDRLSHMQVPDYLTRRQVFGILMYSSNYYPTINSILRSNNRESEDFKKHMPLFEAIDSGLMNISPYVGMTYRGTNMPQSELDKHKTGATYLNLAYTSTAYEKGGWYNASVKLDINCHTGCCIEQYSFYPSEKEVLYIRYMSYKITKAEKISDNQYHFETDECIEKFRR